MFINSVISLIFVSSKFIKLSWFIIAEKLFIKYKLNEFIIGNNKIINLFVYLFNIIKYIKYVNKKPINVRFKFKKMLPLFRKIFFVNGQEYSKNDITLNKSI